MMVSRGGTRGTRGAPAVPLLPLLPPCETHPAGLPLAHPAAPRRASLPRKSFPALHFRDHHMMASRIVTVCAAALLAAAPALCQGSDSASTRRASSGSARSAAAPARAAARPSAMNDRDV